MTRPYDETNPAPLTYREKQMLYSPPDRQTLFTEIRRQYATGLRPWDIATAMKIEIGLVNEALATMPKTN